MMGEDRKRTSELGLSLELCKKLRFFTGMQYADELINVNAKKLVEKAKLTEKEFMSLLNAMMKNGLHLAMPPQDVANMHFFEPSDIIETACGEISDDDDIYGADFEDEEIVYPGKRKCELLKQIRREIAVANNIVYLTAECTHKGPCKGTCPMCDAEIKYLENELNEKAARGEKIVLSGISLNSFDSFIDDEDEDEEIISMGMPLDFDEPPSMGQKSTRRRR